MSATAPLLVLHIPHSSVTVPDDVRPSIVLSDAELACEILAMTDHFTDELFVAPGSSTRVVYPASRLVLDPERFIDDADEIMATRGMGLVYTRTSTCALLRNPPTTRERSDLIDRFYAPHHGALTAAVDESMGRWGKCLIVDCHSFPSSPNPYELDQDPNRPDICIGTDEAHTAEWLCDLTCELFRAEGMTVAVNRPFAGALVPTKFYRVSPKVQSIMIELNRRLYMNESTGARSAQCAELSGIVTSILARLTEAVETSDSP